MDGALLHLEVLGPRAGADAWLATLQSAGTCHLADALLGLEGEAGIGRPRPRDEERRAADLRAPVLLAVRGLAGVLPAAAPGAPESWSLPPGGVDEDALAARCAGTLAAALRVRHGLEAARESDRVVESLERARAAVRAAAAAGAPVVPARAWEHAGSGAKRLLGRLSSARAGIGVSGAFEAVVVAGEVPAGVAVLLVKSGLTSFDLPLDLAGQTPDAALASLEPRLRTAQEAAAAARTALAARLASDGAECRRALDGLEDADARERAQRLLASTGHVAAARVYVDAEHRADLVHRLDRAHGPAVVVRALAPSGDTPTAVRTLASPLHVLGLLHPRRFGERGALGTLALVTPLVVAFLSAHLVLGFLPSGARMDVWFVGLLAAAALLLAAYGLVVLLTVRHGAERRAEVHGAHRRCALLGFTAYAIAARGATPSVLAGGYAAALFLLVPRAEFGRLAQDVLAVARTWAVGGVALLALLWCLERTLWPDALVMAIVLPAVAVLVVLDAAATAMGWTYDLMLGPRRAAPPFTPFARSGRAPGRSS